MKITDTVLALAFVLTGYLIFNGFSPAEEGDSQVASLKSRIDSLERKLTALTTTCKNTDTRHDERLETLNTKMEDLKRAKRNFYSSSNHAFMRTETDPKSGVSYEFLLAPYGELVLRKIGPGGGQKRVDIFP